MRCPLRDIAKSAWDFIIYDVIINGGTNNAYKLSLEKKRIAPPQSQLHVVPQGTNTFTNPNAPVPHFTTHFAAHNDTYLTGNGIGHDGSSNLIVPGWAIIILLATVSLIFFSATGLAVAYQTQRARSRRAMAATESRAESAEKRVSKERTRTTRARKNISLIRNNLSSVKSSRSSIEKKLSSAEGALQLVSAQYTFAINTLSHAEDTIKNLERDADVLSQESSKANAKVAALKKQLSVVKEDNKTLRQKNHKLKAKAKTKAFKKSWKWHELNNTHTGRVLELESKNRVVNNRVKTLQSDRDQAKARLAQVKTNHASYFKAKARTSAMRSEWSIRNAKDTARKEVRELKRKVFSIVEDFESTLSKSDADVKAQQSANLDLQKAQASLQERLEEGERDKKILQAALEQSQTREAVSGWQIVALNVRVSALQKRDEMLTTTLASTEQDKEGITRELQAAKVKAKAAVDALDVEKETNGKRQRKAAESIAQANARVEQESSRAIAVEQEKASLEVQLSTATSQYTDLNTLLEDVELDFAREREACRNEARKLRSEIWIVQTDHAGLNAVLEAVYREIGTMEAANEKLQRRLQDHERFLSVKSSWDQFHTQAEKSDEEQPDDGNLDKDGADGEDDAEERESSNTEGSGDGPSTDDRHPPGQSVEGANDGNDEDPDEDFGTSGSRRILASSAVQSPQTRSTWSASPATDETQDPNGDLVTTSISDEQPFDIDATAFVPSANSKPVFRPPPATTYQQDTTWQKEIIAQSSRSFPGHENSQIGSLTPSDTAEDVENGSKANQSSQNLDRETGLRADSATALAGTRDSSWNPKAAWFTPPGMNDSNDLTEVAQAPSVAEAGAEHTLASIAEDNADEEAVEQTEASKAEWKQKRKELRKAGLLPARSAWRKRE